MNEIDKAVIKELVKPVVVIMGLGLLFWMLLMWENSESVRNQREIDKFFCFPRNMTADIYPNSTTVYPAHWENGTLTYPNMSIPSKPLDQPKLIFS